MSMNNYCCYEDCIEEAFVKEMCPDEYKALMEILDQEETDFFAFCDGIYNDCDDVPIRAIGAFEVLQNAFQDKTKLTLNVTYCNAEERSDELDGGSFTIDNAYQLTEAAKKHEKHIGRKHWTVFG